MTNHRQQIDELMKQRGQLDARIVAIDGQISTLLEEQRQDSDPVRGARNAAIRDAFLALGDLLYELGRVTAMIQASQASLGESQTGQVLSASVLETMRKRRDNRKDME